MVCLRGHPQGGVWCGKRLSLCPPTPGTERGPSYLALGRAVERRGHKSGPVCEPCAHQGAIYSRKMVLSLSCLYTRSLGKTQKQNKNPTPKHTVSKHLTDLVCTEGAATEAPFQRRGFYLSRCTLCGFGQTAYLLRVSENNTF